MLSSPFALTLPAVAIGSLACKVELHWTEKDVVVVSARSIPHSFPRVENLEQVCTLLEIDTTGQELVGNEAGMWARVELPRVVVEAGNAVALSLLMAADEQAARFAAEGVAALATASEPAEA